MDEPQAPRVSWSSASCWLTSSVTRIRRPASTAVAALSQAPRAAQRQRDRRTRGLGGEDLGSLGQWLLCSWQSGRLPRVCWGEPPATRSVPARRLWSR
jgi:hypothetical protein